MLSRLLRLARTEGENLTALRRHFHAHPELSFEEYATTERVAAVLTEAGYENLQIGVAGRRTGVIADLNGHLRGPRIALRADMDGLPLDEEGDLPYRSRHRGVMHACGHDAHTAILLGAALILRRIADDLPGPVRFLFQPSEESHVESGARAMIAQGALRDVGAVAGLHVWSPLPSGVIGYCPGPIMASADAWRCTVHGRGGHGAMPQDAVDPVVAASQMVGMLQTIVSRETNPLDTAVVTVGRIEGGKAFNVIPDDVTLEGTVRTFNPSLQASIPERMGRIFRGVAEAARCRVSFDYKEVLPATINDPAMTDLARRTALELTGDADQVRPVAPTMSAEDMSLYLREVPGTFLFLGTGNEAKGLTAPHHHPRFDVDDAVLPLGAALLASLAWKYLQGR